MSAEASAIPAFYLVGLGTSEVVPLPFLCLGPLQCRVVADELPELLRVAAEFVCNDFWCDHDAIMRPLLAVEMRSTDRSPVEPAFGTHHREVQASCHASMWR